MTTRREFVAGAAAGFALRTAVSAPAEVRRAARPLDVLVLGGTGFLGPHQVEHVLARGHRLALFNRGRSARNLYGARVEQLIGNRDARIDRGLKALEGTRRWDVVIDNSGYLPRHVRDSVELLAGRIGRYVFVSTVAVYEPGSRTVVDESSPLRRPPDPQEERTTAETYGPHKVACERAVQERLGARATIVRPTYIVGPGDDTDRFTYWVERMARGGEVLGPPEPGRELQWVDARDLCPWIVALAEQDVAGVFNAAGPAEPTSWQQVLETLATLAERPARLHWARGELLQQLDITLPLVPPPGRPARRFVSSAARAAGLRYRPLLDTAAATLLWWRAQPAERRARAAGWPTAEQERAALARLGVRTTGAQTGTA